MESTDVVPVFTLEEARDVLNKWLEEHSTKMVGGFVTMVHLEYDDFWAIRARVYSKFGAKPYMDGIYGFHVRRGGVTVINKEAD